MKFRNAVWFIVLLVSGRAALADEYGVALGVFSLARQGADIQLYHRIEQSHWL